MWCGVAGDILGQTDTINKEESKNKQNIEESNLDNDMICEGERDLTLKDAQ